MNSFIGTKEAAAKLRISVRRVQALIAAGKLPAEKIGNSFAIRESDLRLLNGRKNGRAPKLRERTQKEWNAILDKYVGCLDNLPPDLSTNPKYMEGYARKKTSDHRR